MLVRPFRADADRAPTTDEVIAVVRTAVLPAVQERIAASAE